jgi:hypothetical protein
MRGGDRWALAAHGLVAGAALAVRTLALHGLGGAGDAGPALGGRLLQIGGGLVHALLGSALPEAIAWVVGGGGLVWATWNAVRRREALPLLWTAIAVLPLLAAGWVVGARYFYLPAVGVVLLLADALAGATLAGGLVVACLLALGTGSALAAREAAREYRARLAVAGQAVAAERARGARFIRVRCGIQNLDLALDSRLTRDLVVWSDVPLSFALMPPDLVERARVLLASPPLPPSGAYAFGAARIVGLRDPPPDELARLLPEASSVSLIRTAGGLSWRRDGPGARLQVRPAEGAR